MRHIIILIMIYILNSCSGEINEEKRNDSNDVYYFDGHLSTYIYNKINLGKKHKGSYFSEIPYYFLQEKYGRVIYNKHLAENARDSALVGISYLKHTECDTQMFKLYYENFDYYRGRRRNPYYDLMNFYKRNHFNLDLPHETRSAIIGARSGSRHDPIIWKTHRVFYINHFEDIMKHDIHRGGLLNLIDILQGEASPEDLPKYTIDPEKYDLYNKDVLYFIDYLMCEDTAGKANWEHAYKYNALLEIADPDWNGDLDSLLSSYQQKSCSREEYLYFSLKLLNAGKVINLEKRKIAFDEKIFEIYYELVNDFDSIPLKFAYYFLDNDNIDICKLHHNFVNPTECVKLRDVFIRNYYGKKCAIKNSNCAEVIEHFNELQSLLIHLPKFLRGDKENWFIRMAEQGLNEYELCLND